MKKSIVTAFSVLFLVVSAHAISPRSGANSSKSTVANATQINRVIIENSNNPGSDITFDFENYIAGKLASDWSQYFTGSGGTNWKIIDDNGNKVMAQLYSDNPENHFNVVVNNKVIAKDMKMTVRLKGVTGEYDKGGGLVWRFTDKNNYYVVRANPEEDNVVLYKMENGKRSDLPLVGKGRTYGVDVDKLGLGWNTLSLMVKGDLFTVFLNGKELFKVKDSTFTKKGKVGLWSKADAVTYFDDFKITQY